MPFIVFGVDDSAQHSFSFSKSELNLLILAKHIVMISMKFLLFSLAKLVLFHFVTSSTAAATVIVEAVMINTVDRSPEAS